MPTERPILFSAEMVRALLEGRKTQTRRLLKLPAHAHQPTTDWVKSIHRDGGGNWIAWSTNEPGLAEFTKRAYPNGEGFRCPYGREGDALWVKEAFGIGVMAWTDCGWEAVGLTYDGPLTPRPADSVWDKYWVEYPATSAYEMCEGERWRPSIHMPRWASRITLQITAVRAQRLQDIDDADARAEGVTFPSREATFYEGKWVAAYAALWDRINQHRSGCAWADNPWVWALTFEVVAPAGVGRPPE